VKDMCTKFLPKGSVAVEIPMNDVTPCNDKWLTLNAYVMFLNQDKRTK